MGIYDNLDRLDTEREPERSSREPTASTSSTGRSTSRPVSRQGNQQAGRSSDSAASQSSRRYAGALQDSSPILPRPKAFYITQRQDSQIDEAVRRVSQHPRVQKRLQAKIMAQPDRSMVMRLFLDRLDGEDDELISQLVDQLIDQPVDSDL